MASAISGLMERVLIVTVLFYSAYFLMLPVPLTEAVVYPWWASRIAWGNIIAFEVAFIAWIALFGTGFLRRQLLNNTGILGVSALLLVCLGVWCGIISLMSPLPAADFARSLRLLVIACLLLSAGRWSRQMGETTLLVLVLGCLAGIGVNLLMTFLDPPIVNGTMRLAGQNTPGVVAAVAIHLAAWLFLFSTNRAVQILALVTALVCSFACAISFSRIGWIVSALGLFAWAYILLFPGRPRLSREWDLRKAPMFWLSTGAAVGAIGLFVFSSQVLTVFNWLAQLFGEKEWFGGQSNDFRLAYYEGTWEIILRYPFGVGYSGFLDAMRATEIYEAGLATRETSYDANPHSTFLYYISAGGIPAALIVATLFVALMAALRHGLTSLFGTSGAVFFALIAISYLVIGLTVPYLFNSIVLVVPVAIVAGLATSEAERQALGKSGAAFVHSSQQH
jgi:O-antigen ligase